MISTRTFFRKEKDLFYEEGLQVGKEQGIEVGKEIGEVEAKKKVAIRLKELGLEAGFISQALNVSIEEVDKIQMP